MFLESNGTLFSSNNERTWLEIPVVISDVFFPFHGSNTEERSHICRTEPAERGFPREGFDMFNNTTHHISPKIRANHHYSRVVWWLNASQCPAVKKKKSDRGWKRISKLTQNVELSGIKRMTAKCSQGSFSRLTRSHLLHVWSPITWTIYVVHVRKSHKVKQHTCSCT